MVIFFSPPDEFTYILVGKDASRAFINRGAIRFILESLFSIISFFDNQNESSASTIDRNSDRMNQKRLFEAICGAIHSLSFHMSKGQIVQNFCSFMQREMIDFLFKGMDCLKDIADAETYLECIWTLLNLCYVSPENQTYIAEDHKGIDFIVEVMSMFAENAQIQEKGRVR